MSPLLIARTVALGLALFAAGCPSSRAPVDRPTDTDTDTTPRPSDTDTDSVPTTTEIPDRGAWAGSDPGVDGRRAAFDLVDPPEPGNPNDLAAAPGTQQHDPQDEEYQDRLPTIGLTLIIEGGKPTVWSSAEGVLASEDYVQSDYVSNWPFPEGREECVAPEVMITCCSRTLVEGDDSSTDTTDYYKPADLFADEDSAEAALKEIYAQVPFFLPYTHPDVKLSHGWIYDGDERKGHASHDYSKTGVEEGEDPTFAVRAASWGTVVTKYWDPWSGNIVVIEHDDVGDFEYRTGYHHLRDGKTHDLALAQQTEATGDDEARQDKYLKFANLPNPKDEWWGTDDHEILVEVGDHVGAHQLIAWSGNTGPGGAGLGLNTDGTPTNSITANNHLHYWFAVRHPIYTAGEWMFVDPQAVYDQEESGCYEVLENTRFDRLVAPFYPYFHGVDLGVFNAYLYYYGQMGRSPATLSVQQPGDGATAAGAFKPGLGTSWYVYDYLKAADWESYWQDTVDAGFELVDRSVTLDTLGTPRHNGLFRPDTGEGWFSYGSLTIAEYEDQFDEHTDDGFDLVDFFGYHDGNADRIAAIFAPEPGSFIHHGLVDSDTYTDLTNDYAEDGWLPVDVNVMELAGGTWLSGLYRQTGDAGRMVHWGMSAEEYQQWMDFYLSEGWDLEVVQNYDAGERYAAIWSI